MWSTKGSYIFPGCVETFGSNDVCGGLADYMLKYDNKTNSRHKSPDELYMEKMEIQMRKLIELLTLMIISCALSCMIVCADDGILVQETEPNDVYTKADAFALEGFAKGSLSSAGDTDWWTFTVKKKGLYSVELIPDSWVMEDTDHSGWKVSLLDSKHREIAKGTLLKIIIRFNKKAFGPGKYYIRVQHEAGSFLRATTDGGSEMGYRIMVSDKTKETEGSSGSKAKKSLPKAKASKKKKATSVRKKSGIKKTVKYLNR